MTILSESNLLTRLMATTPRQSKRKTPASGYGVLLFAPVDGAKGIAGLRADLIANRITVREVTMMTPGELGKRYSVGRTRARAMRKLVSEHGIHGRTRYLDGTPKPKPSST